MAHCQLMTWKCLICQDNIYIFLENLSHNSVSIKEIYLIKLLIFKTILQTNASIFKTVFFYRQTVWQSLTHFLITLIYLLIFFTRKQNLKKNLTLKHWKKNSNSSRFPKNSKPGLKRGKWQWRSLTEALPCKFSKQMRPLAFGVKQHNMHLEDIRHTRHSVQDGFARRTHTHHSVCFGVSINYTAVTECIHCAWADSHDITHISARRLIYNAWN